MISNSTRSPPKIRLKKINMEMYESIFRNNLNASIKPLKPPPFTLAEVKHIKISLESNQEPNSNQHVITPNSVAQVANLEKVPKEDTHDAAILLASMKNLIAKEMHTQSTKPRTIALPSFPDIEKLFKRDAASNSESNYGAGSNSFIRIPTSLIPSKTPKGISAMSEVTEANVLPRVRTVSMDSHNSIASSKEEGNTDETATPVLQVVACASPHTLPVLHTIPIESFVPPPKSPRGVDRRKRYLDDHTQELNPIKEQTSEVDDSFKPKAKRQKASKASRPLIETNGAKKSPKHTKAILRKKFSWKNFPELEHFLIENREEYLRHSALNYTMQQKQYNNRLTERLIDLAAGCGYVFDEEAFTFVSIRDRIRCYFKSYVQSRKKRGVIIGYAARKAGRLSEKELKKSGSAKVKNSSKRGKK